MVGSGKPVNCVQEESDVNGDPTSEVVVTLTKDGIDIPPSLPDDRPLCSNTSNVRRWLDNTSDDDADNDVVFTESAEECSPASTIQLSASDSEMQGMKDSIDRNEDRTSTMIAENEFDEATDLNCVYYICAEIIRIAGLSEDK